MHIKLPAREEFLHGVHQYEKGEERDAMYKVASFLVDHFWGKPSDMADGLGVLLLTWNQASYRYGSFLFDGFEEFITKNLILLNTFRDRDILTLSPNDIGNIEFLFEQLLDVLKISSGKAKGRKSPVAVAKTLHLLAPDFFPIWDDNIARAYSCHYSENPVDSYIRFCEIIKEFAKSIRDYNIPREKPLIKLIDQYNYSKYTKHWIP